MFKIGVLSNRWLFVGVILMVILQLLFTYLPAMQRVFGTEGLGGADWLLILAISAFIYGAVGIEKWFQRRS